MNVEYKAESVYMAERIKNLQAENLAMRELIQSLVEIGKRDLTNPKYDSYFVDMKEFIKQPETELLAKRFAAAERVCESLFENDLRGRLEHAYCEWKACCPSGTKS